MKNLLYKIAYLLVLIGTNTLQAQSVMVSPSIVRFNAAPGKTETKTISVINNTKKTLELKLYLQDWLRDSTGKHLYYKQDTLSRSCTSILSINPESYIKIDSGQIGKILVRLQYPATASNNEMKWAMLFLESISEAKDPSKLKKMSMRVGTAIRVGVHIYQTPPGAITKAVSNIRLLADSAQKGFVYLYMKNTGQVMLDCKAHLELTYLSTGEESILKAVTFPVFPDGFRRVRLDLPKDLKPGNYSVLAVLDYGIDVPLEAVQQNITIH